MTKAKFMENEVHFCALCGEEMLELKNELEELQIKEIQNIEKYRQGSKSNEHRIMVALERIADAQEKQTEILIKWHDGVSGVINAIHELK